MKKIHTLLLFTFHMLTFGQGLNGEIGLNNNYNQYSRGLVCVDEFSYFIERQHFPYSYFTLCSLIKADTLGKILWEVPVNPQFAEIYDVTEIIPSEDHGVYLLGKGIPTCDIPVDCFWFIQKFDANGEVDWQQIWEDPTCYEKTLSGLSQNENGHIFINEWDIESSAILTFLPNSYLSNSLFINQNNLSKIEKGTHFNFIFSSESKLFGVNNDGIATDSIEFSTTISDFLVHNDTIYVLTSDSLFSFENDFSPIFSNNFNGFTGYSQLKSLNDHLKFISHASHNQTLLSVDHNLQLVNTFQLPLALKISDPKDYTESHFSTVSNFTISHGNQVIRHLDYSLLSPQNAFVNWTDIGILDLAVSDLSILPYSPQMPNVYTIKIWADVLVKNYGSHTLNAARFNQFIGFGIACGYNYYTQMKENLNIAPGDSAWVSLGQVFQETNYFSGPAIQKEICIYTSHPNFKTDLIIGNDKYCENLILGYVGLEEYELSEKKLVKIVDLMGRETEAIPNQVLIFIYDDGSTEKIFITE